MARVIHRDPTTSGLSWNGQSFARDKQGCFEVPDEALPELLGLGFAPAPAEGVGHMQDLSKLSPKKLVAHAFKAYGVALNPEDGKEALLEQIVALAAKAGDSAPEEAGGE